MVVAAIRRLVDEERLGAVATVVAGPDAGAKAVIDAAAGYVAGELPAAVAADVLADAASLMGKEETRTLSFGEREVFIETVAPPPRLVIFGAVHAAQELCRMADRVGFRVTIADARPAFTTPERFPAAAHVLVGWPEELKDELILDDRTYVVVLSHDARFEDPVLTWALASPARYIGAMGSRRTHAQRVEKLGEWGFDPTDIERIHGPIGLDIGARRPGEIAVAILAEMIRARYGHGTGESLRGQTGSIHPTLDTTS